MTDVNHEPDPQFVSRMESELVAEHRRLDRLGLGSGRRWEPARWIRTAGFVLVGVLAGAVSVTMAQRQSDLEKSQLLLQEAQRNIGIAERRVELSRLVRDDALQRIRAGVVVPEALNPSELEVVEAEARLAMAELEYEQLEAGAGWERDEVWAPLVEGRDFVSERLQIELNALQQRQNLHEPIVEFAEARIRAGLAGDDLADIRIEQERLAALNERLQDTLELRESFVTGAIDAEEAELRHRLLLASANRRMAQAILDEIADRIEMTRRRYDAGIAPSAEMQEAERELLHAENELQMARIETDLLQTELER